MAAVLASRGRVGVVRNAEECWGCSMHGAYHERGAWWCVRVSRREERG
jgi:hypothetical protein